MWQKGVFRYRHPCHHHHRYNLPPHGTPPFKLRATYRPGIGMRADNFRRTKREKTGPVRTGPARHLRKQRGIRVC